MSNQTLLNLILSGVTVYLAIRNYLMATRKESQRESEEMTEIRVQLNQVLGLLQDLQKDLRTTTADFRALDKRVTIIETKLDSLSKDISQLKEEPNGSGKL